MNPVLDDIDSPPAGHADESGWVARANCLGVDPELFFPERGESVRPAKEVCRGCVVRAECLDHALAVPERFGIWGGLSERERRGILRTRLQVSRSAEIRSLPPFGGGR